MRIATLLRIFCFAAALPLAASQPGLDTLRAAWSNALDDWRSANVEADRTLFQRPAPESLAQVEAAAERRRQLTETKRRYVAALAGHYRTLAREWQDQAGGASTPASEAGLRSAVRDAIGDLDIQLKSLAPSDRASAPALQRHRTELLAVQTSLRSREDARVRNGAGRGPAPADLDPAVETLFALANRLETHDAALQQEAEAWDRVYSALKSEVERRAPRAVTPVSEEPATGAAVPLGAEAANAQAVVPSIAGIWFLQNLDARKTEDGAYEPRFINVRITQQDDRVQGSYEAVYAVPEDEPHNPTVRFSFEGRITTETMRFPLRAPLRGSILIERSTPLRIRVSYGIENPEVRNISFGYVPADNPQTLQKKID
jgi:hypothetical protein